MRQKWRDETRTDSWRLRRNQHLQGTETSQATRDITWGGTHHHPQPTLRSDVSCKGQPEDASHSPVIGLSRTSKWIRHTSRTDVHVRSSTWLTLVSQKKSNIDWAHRQLPALRSLSASGVKGMIPMTMAVASNVSEAENDKLLGRCPDIHTLRATAFDNLLASDEVVSAFGLQIGECTGRLGAALEDITLDSPGNVTLALDATSREQRQQLPHKGPSEEMLE